MADPTNAEPIRDPGAPWRDRIMLVLVVVAGCALTMLAAVSLQQTETLRVQERKTAVTQAVISAFNLEITRTTEAIRSAGLMLESNPHLTRDQFDRYMQKLVENQLSVNVMEWQPIVTASQLAAFEAAVRAAGQPHFKVVQPDASGKGWVPVSGRSEYVPVLFAWPDQYRTAGYDMSFSPERMASKLQSRVIGQPVASGAFQFMKQGMVDSGTTAIAISTTVFGEQQTARGYLAAVVDLPTLFQGAKRIADSHKFDLLVWGQTDTGAEPVYAWHGEDSDLNQVPQRQFRATAEDQSTSVDFGYQTWTVILHPRPPFYAESAAYGSRLAFVTGLVITLLIGMALYQVQLRNRRIERAENEVRLLAFYDPLTRLPNRRLLVDRLNQTLASSKRSGLYGAVMFLDLDNFKSLNDSHGHAAGDSLLVEVAKRLSSTVREMDTVARVGGDEFVVMCREFDREIGSSERQVSAIAEKIRARLAEPYLIGVKDAQGLDSRVEHRCSASIGVVLFLGDEASQDQIFGYADAAMYRAKAAGRNRVKFYG